jgi:hypothetical protein
VFTIHTACNRGGGGGGSGPQTDKHRPPNTFTGQFLRRADIYGLVSLQIHWSMLLLLRCRLYVQGEPLAVIPPTPKRLKSYPADPNRTEPTSRRQLQGRLAGLMPRGRFRMPANTPGGRHPQRSPGFFFPFSPCCNPLFGYGTSFCLH